jgi:uncharacterized protein YjlB
MFEDEMEQGKATPWHAHPDSEELIYLLAGEVDLNIDGKTQRMTAGAVWMTPRGVSHAFVVVSPTAKLLAIQSPGSAGQFYWEASEPAESASGAVDFDRIRAVAAATGVTDVQGPPPFVTA